MNALSIGMTTYFAVGPCKNGHFLRYCTTHNCVDCDAVSKSKIKHLMRWRRVQKEYGISEAEFGSMYHNQQGKCAICQHDVDDVKMHIDHCHRTGMVRGLLCQRCNQAIGLMRENEETLKAACEYIRKHNATS